MQVDTLHSEHSLSKVSAGSSATKTPKLPSPCADRGPRQGGATHVRSVRPSFIHSRDRHFLSLSPAPTHAGLWGQRIQNEAVLAPGGT